MKQSNAIGVLAVVSIVLTLLASETRATRGFEGIWSGTASHNGDSSALALRFDPDSAGYKAVLFLPALHVADFPLGRVRQSGDTLRAGPLMVRYDSVAATMVGSYPRELVPVHTISFRLRPAAAPPRMERVELEAPRAEPLWTYETRAAIYSDVSSQGNVVYVADDSGTVHAIDGATGQATWKRRFGGRVRAAPAFAKGAVYVPADDGFLRRLDARTGEERWSVRIDSVIERLPQTHPETRHDVRASGAAVHGDRVYVGTHGGRVLALDAASGKVIWETPVGGSVLATPFVSGNRLYVGDFAGTVHALDAATGRQIWQFDTHAPVTSTPVEVHGVVLAGSRSYDLFGLDAATGAQRWNRYVWFSWIESTPTVVGDIAYVGSSDGAKLLAVDVRTGKLVWDVDVRGLAWGQPAVAGDRVLVATRGAFGGIGHRATVQARDRTTGRLLWQYEIERPKVLGPFGFVGSGALAGNRYVVAGVDGIVRAFDVTAH